MIVDLCHVCTACWTPRTSSRPFSSAVHDPEEDREDAINAKITEKVREWTVHFAASAPPPCESKTTKAEEDVAWIIGCKPGLRFNALRVGVKPTQVEDVMDVPIERQPLVNNNEDVHQSAQAALERAARAAQRLADAAAQAAAVQRAAAAQNAAKNVQAPASAASVVPSPVNTVDAQHGQSANAEASAAAKGAPGKPSGTSQPKGCFCCRRSKQPDYRTVDPPDASP